MKVFAILESGGDDYTYFYSNVLDSIWSTEELALKRLYDLEESYKDDTGFQSKQLIFEIKEIKINDKMKVT